MRTLILYSTKYGFTTECVMYLKEFLIGDIDIVLVEKKTNVDFDKYNKVIIGGPVYIGKTQSVLQKFCFNNMNKIEKKIVGLFLTGIDKNNFLDKIMNSFPEEIVNCSKVKDFFGGEIKIEKLKFLDKLMINAVKKDFTEMKMEKNAIKAYASIMNRM